VVGVGRGRREKIVGFVERTGAAYPIAVDARATFRAWDVEVVPASFLLEDGDRVVAEGLDGIERALRARLG
jgi:hypothetical protein